MMFLMLPKSAYICIETDDLGLVPTNSVKLLERSIESKPKVAKHVKCLYEKIVEKQLPSINWRSS